MRKRRRIRPRCQGQVPTLAASGIEGRSSLLLLWWWRRKRRWRRRTVPLHSPPRPLARVPGAAGEDAPGRSSSETAICPPWPVLRLRWQQQPLLPRGYSPLPRRVPSVPSGRRRRGRTRTRAQSRRFSRTPPTRRLLPPEPPQRGHSSASGRGARTCWRACEVSHARAGASGAAPSRVGGCTARGKKRKKMTRKKRTGRRCYRPLAHPTMTGEGRS